jgi:hypothetical protein
MYHPIGLAKTLFPDSAAFRLLTCVTMSAGRRAAPLRPHYLSFIQNRSSRAILHRFTVLARARSSSPSSSALRSWASPTHCAPQAAKGCSRPSPTAHKLGSWGGSRHSPSCCEAPKPATPIAHVGLAETEWPEEEGDGRRGGFGGDRGSRGRGRPTVWGLWREGGWGSLPVSRGQTKGPCGCRRRRRPRGRAGGLRVVSVARGAHTLRLSSSQAGGPRVSGEVGGVHRAERTEVSGVSGGLSRLPEAMWRCGVLGVAVGLRARRRPLSMIVSMSFL